MARKLTKTEIRKEVLKCGKDPVYFIKNYVKIIHPIRGLIPFSLYPFQEEVVEDFRKNRFNVVLKARQLGISTTIAGFIAWLILFHRGKNVLIMATKLDTAGNLVRKVKLAMKSLPKWLTISKIEIDNRNNFKLDNQSQVKAISTSGDAGRSEALSLLVVDEAAHVENMDKLWAGLQPTLSTGGDCIIASTPCGVGNVFHKIYSEAEQNLNDFNPIVLPWDVHPERDLEWYEKECRSLSRREIAQELNCNFNMSGESVIHPDDLLWIKENIQEPKYRTGFDRNLWIWETYKTGEKYFLTADVARGDGGDNSAFVVINVRTLEVVAEYYGQIPHDMFAPLIAETGREYGSCLAVVENNKGDAVLMKLKDLAYPNVYFSRKTTHEYVDQYQAEGQTQVIPGFTMTEKNRRFVIAKLEEMIRNKMIKTHSRRFFSELETFIWTSSRPQAMRGYKDDLTISMAIACWVHETALVANKYDLEYKMALASSIMSSTTKMNTKISGMKGYDRNSPYGKLPQRRDPKDASKIIGLPFFRG